MSKKKILIVEDESIIAKDIQSILTEAGYEVPYFASNSKDALKYIEEIKPDLILMDVIIKGPVDGVTTAQIINQLYDIPIIFLSAYSDNHTLERAKQTSSFGYLLKPCDERELVIAVDFGLQKANMDRLLKNQNKLFSSVICNIETGAIVLNQKRCVELINHQAQLILGWKDFEVLKKNIHEFIPSFESVTLEKKDSYQVNVFTHKSGQALLTLRNIELTDEQNNITGYLIFISAAETKKNAS